MTEREEFARPLRHDIEAERAVLGSMMLSADALAECLELVRPATFHRPAHQIVFAAVAALADQGDPVDWLTVKAELERRGDLRQAGGPLCTHDLMSAVPSPANGPWYARKLVDYQSQRDLKTAGMAIGQIADESEASRQERIERAYAALDEACGYTVKTGARPVSELIVPLMESLERGPDAEPGIATGSSDLNRALSGLRPGQLVVVAGRPAMGKSVVLLGLAAHAALRDGHRVLAVTLEMSQDEYMERLMAAEAMVDLTRIRERKLERDDWDRIGKSYTDFSQGRTLLIHEGPQLTVQDIRAELRAMRRQNQPADLLILDYIQLVTGASAKKENRQAEVSEISRGLKLLGKEFAIPVIVGAQLNRGPEQRTDHRPVLADIRESGALEQDADVVILLYRDDAYYDDSAHAGEIDLIIAKNRSGPKTTVSMAFQGHYSRAVDMAAMPWSPASSLGGSQ